MNDVASGGHRNSVSDDFSFDNGDLNRAFLSFTVAFLLFVIVPLSIYAVVDGTVNQAILSNSINPQDIEEVRILMTSFWTYLSRFVSYSVPLLILSIPIGFYPAGNYAKIPFRVLAALYMIVLVIILTNGGHVAITLFNVISTGQFTINALSSEFIIKPIIYIVSIICITKACLAFAEFSGSRKKYLEHLSEKYTSSGTGQQEEE